MSLDEEEKKKRNRRLRYHWKYGKREEAGDLHRQNAENLRQKNVNLRTPNTQV